MAVEILGRRIGMLAAKADLSAKQFYFVKETSTGVDVCDDPKSCLGVLQNKPVTGDAASIAVDGVSKVIAGTGDITVGAHITCSATGTAVVATTAQVVIGVCVVAATAGNIGSISLAITNSPAA